MTAKSQESENNKAVSKLIKKSQKKERKLRRRLFSEAAKSVGAGKRAQREYLRSGAVRIAGVVAANQRARVRDRKSLAQCIEAAESFDALGSLKERMKVFTKRKASGKLRWIVVFGPAARGAQRIVLRALEPHIKLRSFQYSQKGIGRVLDRAEVAILAGAHWFTEIDILSHFPSFDRKNLPELLPLPAKAVVAVALAHRQPAYWLHTGESLSPDAVAQIRQGIPQGAATSPWIAEFIVSRLDLKLSAGVILLNYADNFFVFAKSPEEVEAAAKALGEALASLPGGPFVGVVKQSARSAMVGFQMLGHHCHLVGGKFECTLTDAQYEAVAEMAWKMELECRSSLGRYAARGRAGNRRLALAAFGRLRRYLLAWREAFKRCCDIDEIFLPMAEDCGSLAQDYASFGFSFDELLSAKDGAERPAFSLSYGATE